MTPDEELTDYCNLNSMLHKDVDTVADHIIHLQIHHSLGWVAIKGKKLEQIKMLHRLHHNVRDRSELHPNSRAWSTT